jgi:hypothetical protein
VVLGSVIPYLLAELNLLQLADQPGGQDERDEKGRHRGVNDPKTQIPKDVQEAVLGV